MPAIHNLIMFVYEHYALLLLVPLMRAVQPLFRALDM